MTARDPETPRWARRRLSTLVGAAGAGLIVLVALASAGLVWTITNLRDANEDARHSERVLTTALDTERAVLDLETGQRGFIITSDPSFLEPWRRGQAAAPRSARELAAMVSDNAAQHRRALAIVAAIQSYVDDYSKPLVASAQAGERRARSVVATASGKRRVDALRAQFDGFTRAERRLLDARTKRARSWAPRATAAAAVMLVVLGGLIVLLVLLARRLVVRPVERVTAAAGQVAGGALDARVEEGGAGEIATLTARFNEMAAALESGEAVRAEQYRELERLRRADVALLDAVFDQSPVGLGLWDGELRFVRVNPALAVIDGVPAEAHIGRRLEEVLPELDASAGDAVRRVLDTGEPVLEIELEGETPAAPGRAAPVARQLLPDPHRGRALQRGRRPGGRHDRRAAGSARARAARGGGARGGRLAGAPARGPRGAHPRRLARRRTGRDRGPGARDRASRRRRRRPAGRWPPPRVDRARHRAARVEPRPDRLRRRRPARGRHRGCDAAPGRPRERARATIRTSATSSERATSPPGRSCRWRRAGPRSARSGSRTATPRGSRTPVR